jgi:hypothetical protein
MKLYLKVNIDFSGNDVMVYIDTKVASIKEPVFNYKNEDYTPTKGDKFYFLPGVNIPRIKLKDMALKHGVRNVRNIEDATHIFGGNSSYPRMVNRSYEYIAKTKDFLDFMELVKDHVDEYYMEKVKQAFEFYDLEHIILQKNLISLLRWNCDSDHPLYEAMKDTSLCEDTDNIYVYSVDSDHEEDFKNMIDKEIWSEDALLVHVNGEDAVTIDAAMYDQIADMFKSSDSDNHILAMEIMANSNYKESLLYLEILFKEFSSTMYNSPTKKHVNFKGLLSYLDKESSMSTNMNDIMHSLTNKGVLTVDMLNILMSRYYTEIERGGNNQYFRVKTITVNEDTLALLNTNYNYKVLEDYQPEVVNTPEEELETFPELHGNLDDLVGPTHVCNDAAQEEELTDEDIEDAFTNIVRNELKSELIELEEESPEPEEETDNNQTTQTKDDDFEWF